jgi:hypothetical protein
MQFVVYGIMTMDANVFMIGFLPQKKRFRKSCDEGQTFYLTSYQGMPHFQCGHGYILFSKMKNKELSRYKAQWNFI